MSRVPQARNRIRALAAALKPFAQYYNETIKTDSPTFCGVFITSNHFLCHTLLVDTYTRSCKAIEVTSIAASLSATYLA